MAISSLAVQWVCWVLCVLTPALEGAELPRRESAELYNNIEDCCDGFDGGCWDVCGCAHACIMYAWFESEKLSLLDGR